MTRPKSGKELRKGVTIGIKKSLLDKVRTIDPYYNLSENVENMLIKYLDENSEVVAGLNLGDFNG